MIVVPGPDVELFLEAVVATTMLRDETGEDLCFFVQVLDVEASPSAPLPPELEHQPVVDFTCDREGRLVGVSPVAKLFGWNPEELQSVATLDLVHPADRARAEAALHAVILQPGVPVALPTLRLRDREGSWWPVEAVAVNLLEHQPGVIRLSARIGNPDDVGKSEVRILDPEPDERAPEGLAGSLRSLAATIGSRAGSKVEIRDEVEMRFAVRIEAAVYKIVEEALTNVMRHASATSVTVSLTHSGETLTILVEDDGAGFEPEHRSLMPGRGMGLLCMEERARLLDGTLWIECTPGTGTVVRATLTVPPPGSPPIGRDGVAVRLPEARS